MDKSCCFFILSFLKSEISQSELSGFSDFNFAKRFQEFSCLLVHFFRNWLRITKPVLSNFSFQELFTKYLRLKTQQTQNKEQIRHYCFHMGAILALRGWLEFIFLTITVFSIRYIQSHVQTPARMPLVASKIQYASFLFMKLIIWDNLTKKMKENKNIKFNI